MQGATGGGTPELRVWGKAGSSSLPSPEVRGVTFLWPVSMIWQQLSCNFEGDVPCLLPMTMMSTAAWPHHAKSASWCLRIVCAGFFVLMLLMLSGCARNSATIKYKETITYEIDGIEYVASGVYEQLYLAEDTLARGNNLLRTPLYGSAMHLPNPSGRYLYALLRYPYLPDDQGVSLLTDACGLGTYASNGNADQFVSAVKRLSINCEVPPRAWPLVVEVGNIKTNGKRSVKYVSPSNFITSVKISLTTDEVTYNDYRNLVKQIVRTKVKVPDLKYNDGYVDVHEVDIVR